MTSTFYLVTPIGSQRYRLPFPFTTRAAAERHNATLGGRNTVVEVIEKQWTEADADAFEFADEMAAIERAEALASERWCSDTWDT